MRANRTIRQLIVLAISILTMLLISGLLQASPPSSGDSHKISGEIVDPSGAPLPRVLVEVRDDQGKPVATTQTNGRGQFAVDLPPGKYNLSANLAGFVTLKNYPVAVPGTVFPLKFTLEISSPHEQVVVTATRTETPLSQVGSSVSVISGEEMALRGMLSVSDALRELAGITLVQSGGVGKITSLFLRGGESDYTKVLIDGIAVNEPGGSYNFAHLSAASIDRIEVVRGPQSALFGSDAISGVIQIFTKRGKSEYLSPRPSLTIEGGSYSTLRYGVGLEGSNERMDYSLSFSRLDTDNDVSYQRDGKTLRLQNAAFNNATFAGNLGLRLSQKTEMRAIFRSDAGRSGTPGSWAFGRPDLDAYYRRRDVAGALSFTHIQTPAWTQRISYTVNDSRQFSANPLDSGSYIPQYKERVAPFPRYDWVYENLNHTRRQKLSYQSDLILPHGHVLTAGADYERESGVVGDPRLNPVSVSRNNYAGFVQNQWSPNNRFFATAGVRLDHNESFGLYASPRISLAMLARQAGGDQPLGMTKIKANFGLGIKEPTLVESYSTSIYYQGNPDLRPEKTASFDVGIEQHFHSGRAIAELTYFQSRFRDQIGFAITDYVTFAGSFFNMGRSRARGLEAALRYNLPGNFEFKGNYTFLDSEVLETSNTFDPAFAQGQELLRRPRHSGYIDLRWKPGRLTLGANTILVGSRVDADFSGLNMTRNKGYCLLNLLANLRITGDISIFGALNNVTNEFYMEALGYPGLGRHFRIGLRAGF